MQRLVENKEYASVEEIPPYELKTTLQRVIQVLKRHRDVHFLDDCTYAPISMIITTLATHAYEGESSLTNALLGVVSRMPQFVKPSRPRIENPVNKKEDFADKWAADPNLEINFWTWHAQLTRDMKALLESESGYLLQESVSKAFNIELNDDMVGIPRYSNAKPSVIAAPAPLFIPQGPKPWGN